MDYEKKYKAALERAKEILECSKKQDSKEVRMVLSFFPELKEESEDERIRKALVQFFKEKDEEDFEEWVPKANVLDWLEMQGKNKVGISEATKKELEDNLNKALEKETPESWNEFLDEKNPYGQRQECVDCQMNYGGQCKGSCAEQLFKAIHEAGYMWDTEGKQLVFLKAEPNEQKPVWSEEDENRINRLIAYFEDKESFTAEDDVVYLIGSIPSKIDTLGNQVMSR